MGKLDKPGYPLPAGDLGEDEIVCQLVFFPNRDEYWQALLGALSYMATWRAWERDDDKRGKDAASNWREAFELTIGCWRMACLEQLQQDVSDILALLRNQDACCGDIITYYDNSTYITIIIPGDGEAPEFYGETEVEDWDEWSEYLCHNAHLWVDELVRAGETIATALSTGGITIGLLAAIIAAVTFFVVGGVLALPLLMVIAFGLSVEVSSVVFDDAVDDIEAARDDIVCALLSGRSVGAAVEDALSSGAAWDLLYTHLDYDSATAILYEGGDGETFLESEKRDDCVCECVHAVSLFYPENEMIEQSSAGCVIVCGYQDQPPFYDTINAQIHFNAVAEGGYCGPMKVIDTISVDDSLGFAYIQLLDQDAQVIVTFYAETTTCTELIGQAQGYTCARINFIRHAPGAPWFGCGSDPLTVRITYHDVV